MPSDLTAPLSYILRQDTTPYFLSQAYTGGAQEYHFEMEERATEVRNLRPEADRFALDREGFAFRRAPTEVDLYDDDAVESAYYAEVEALLTEELGASRVVIFDATRRSDGGAGAKNKDGMRGAASRIHVDYTTKSGPQRAKDVLGEDEFARLTTAGARIVQVNVWRPTKGPVQRSPLAVAEALSIPSADLIATEQIFPDRVGEIYHLAHSEAQKWWYAPEMTPDEVLLLKGWDTEQDGRAVFTPHTAFPLPDQDKAPARESIEIRALVVIE